LTSSRRARPLATAAVAVLLLSGCGAGQDAQTSQARGSSEGANVVVDADGSMLVRNAYIAPPPQDEGEYSEGDDVRVFAVLVNQSDSDDRLVSVDTPAAESVTFFAGGDPEEGLSERTEEFLQFVPEGADQREGGPDTRSVPEGAGGAEGPDGTEIDGVDVPANSVAELLPGTGYLLLEGLTESVFPGQTVPVTMQFERAGSVTFDVYVHLLGEAFEREPVTEPRQEGITGEEEGGDEE
jgi:copper(I)-binding protein